MGRDDDAPSPARGAGSSSGQKRTAAAIEDGGDDNVPSWLKLSLGPVVYSDATTEVDDSGAPEERPPSPADLQHAVDVLSGSATQAPSVPPVDANNDANNDAVAPAFVASATGVLIDHDNEGAFMATGLLLAAGDASGSIPTPLPAACDGNGAISAAPCFNFISSSTSSGSYLQHHHQSSSVHHPARSTRRRSNAYTVGSSGSEADAPTNIGDGANSTGGDSNNNNVIGNILANPPYPWATNEVAKHHSFAELSRRGITHLEGEAQCKRCDIRKMIVYNIGAKFQEVAEYFRQNYLDMNDRASARWMNPTIPDCDKCGQKNSMRPVIVAEKEHINWLFLLLGETLCLCTLDQLKYFCAHTNRHRTGSKDRVLYSTYLELCNQLFPGIIPSERNAAHHQLRRIH